MKLATNVFHRKTILTRKSQKGVKDQSQGWLAISEEANV
jgi:hypothetical protein